MIRFVFCMAAPAAALLMCGFAWAGDIDPEIVKNQAGTYLIAPENGAPGCTVTLETAEAIGGYTLSGAEGCAKPLPVLVASYSWNFDGNGGVVLIDVTRKVLARFVESEGAPLKTDERTPLMLLAAPKGVDRLPTPGSLAGTWTLRRPDGEVLCKVALAGEVSKDGNARMSPSGDCLPAVAKLKLSSYQTNGFGLVLMGSDGETLSFDMQQDGDFEKAREAGGKPLLMTRKR